MAAALSASPWGPSRVRVCVCVCPCRCARTPGKHGLCGRRGSLAARGPLAAGLRSLSPQVLSEGALGPRAGAPRGGRGHLGVSELLVWYLAHTRSGWRGAGWCVRVWGAASTGRPREGPLPPPQDTQQIHKAAPTLVQTCAQSHAWWHAPRSMRTPGPVAHPRPDTHRLAWWQATPPPVCTPRRPCGGQTRGSPPNHVCTRRLA